MIVEYHRPDSLEDAHKLLSRKTPKTIPLGGGTAAQQLNLSQYAVVDLQNLGLNKTYMKNNFIHIGATLELVELASGGILTEGEYIELPEAIKKAASLEGTYNLRQVATVAGTIVSASGRSPLTTCFLAMDAHLKYYPDQMNEKLGEFLPLRGSHPQIRIITELIIPGNIKLAYQSISRTPVDRPIVCAAVAIWPSGRTRAAIGGHGNEPILVFDGPESGGIDKAAKDACSMAADEWADASYRSEMAGLLTQRCLDELSG